MARWYYSSPREGEIFFREKDWPYRKIMRGCSRLLAPPASSSVEQSSAPALPTRINRLIRYVDESMQCGGKLFRMKFAQGS